MHKVSCVSSFRRVDFQNLRIKVWLLDLTTWLTKQVIGKLLFQINHSQAKSKMMNAVYLTLVLCIPAMVGQSINAIADIYVAYYDNESAR